MSFDKYSSLLFGHGVSNTAFNSKSLKTIKSLIESSPQQFLQFLKHNVPKTSLSVIQFRVSCLLLNYALAACYKVSDFKSINAFYSLSSEFGTSDCILCRHFFVKSPIWTSDRLWVDCIMSSLSVDICKWKVLRYLGTNRKSTWNSHSMSHLNSNEVLAVIVISRIQSYAISMRSLGVVMDRICEIVAIIVDKLDLLSFHLNWKVFPSRAFVISALDSVVAATITQEERYRLHQSVDDALDNRELLGHSALVDVLLGVETVYALRHSETTTPAATHQCKNYNKQFCLCGHSLTSWSVVGVDNLIASDSLITERHKITSALCEKCYRLLQANPLNAEVDMTYCGGICPIYSTESTANTVIDFASIYSIHDAVLFVDASTAVNSSPKSHPSNLQDFSATILNAVPSCSLNECGLPASLLSEYQKITSSLESHSNRFSGASGSSSSKTIDTLSELPTAAPLTPRSPSPQVDVSKFIMEFWKGLTVNIVYAGSPTIEKTRVVYFRTNNTQVNEEIDSLIASSTTKNTKLKNSILDSIQQNSLYLCWARRSDKGNLQYLADKSIDMDTIKHVKVGSNKWKQCINISGDVKTMVLKIVDEEVFQRVLNGLLSVVAFRGKQLS